MKNERKTYEYDEETQTFWSQIVNIHYISLSQWSGILLEKYLNLFYKKTKIIGRPGFPSQIPESSLIQNRDQFNWFLGNK